MRIVRIIGIVWSLLGPNALVRLVVFFLVGGTGVSSTLGIQQYVTWYWLLFGLLVFAVIGLANRLAKQEENAPRIFFDAPEVRHVPVSVDRPNLTADVHIVSAKIRNRPHSSIGANSVNAYAEIEFYGDGQRIVHMDMCRWPENAGRRQSVNLGNLTECTLSPNGNPRRLDVAVKRVGDSVLYGMNWRSEDHPGWLYDRLRLPYRVVEAKITITANDLPKPIIQWMRIEVIQPPNRPAATYIDPPACSLFRPGRFLRYRAPLFGS